MWRTVAQMKTSALKAGAADPDAKADVERRGRKASKETRRQQLIEATIDSLAKRGYSETTMADVADGAGLSRGIVNFHFESKEKLLIATLQYMADEYSVHWRGALVKAGPEPANQLRALVAADFDRTICNKRKLAAWCAFWGEAKSRPTYQSLCGARDEAYQREFIELCGRLKEEGGYTFDPYATALGLSAMLEGLWLRLMMGTEEVTREIALRAAFDYLASAFPRHYPRAPVRQKEIA
jgi:AcrR family transcriptional regulator